MEGDPTAERPAMSQPLTAASIQPVVNNRTGRTILERLPASLSDGPAQPAPASHNLGLPKWLGVVVCLVSAVASADPTCDHLATTVQPSGICLDSQAVCTAAVQGCPTVLQRGGNDCQGMAYLNVAGSTANSTAITDATSSLAAGFVVSVDTASLTGPGASAEERVVDNVRLVAVGNGGWTLTGKAVIASSGSRYLKLSKTTSSGTTALGTYLLSGTTSYALKFIRTSELQVSVCQSSTAGDCIASMHSVTLPSATATVLLDTGVLATSQAPSQCEAAHFGINDL